VGRGLNFDLAIEQHRSAQLEGADFVSYRGEEDVHDRFRADADVSCAVLVQDRVAVEELCDGLVVGGEVHVCDANDAIARGRREADDNSGSHIEFVRRQGDMNAPRGRRSVYVRNEAERLSYSWGVCTRSSSSCRGKAFMSTRS
jgi:hypothetical protein